MVIFAGTRGYLDGIGVDDVSRFEDGLLEWFRTRHAGRARRASATPARSRTRTASRRAIKAYAEQFVPSSTSTATRPRREAQAEAESDEAGVRPSPARGGDRPRPVDDRAEDGGLIRWQVHRNGCCAAGSAASRTPRRSRAPWSSSPRPAWSRPSRRANEARPYAEQITQVIQDLAAAGAEVDHPLLRPVDDRREGRRRGHRRGPRPGRRATTRLSSGPPSARSRLPGPRARSTHSSPWAARPRRYFRFRHYPIEAELRRDSPTSPPTRTPSPWPHG